MKNYLALARKEILTHAAMWLDLEPHMLSAIRQTQKDTYCVIPLTCGTQSSQVDRKWMVARGRGEGAMGVIV